MKRLLTYLFLVLGYVLVIHNVALAQSSLPECKGTDSSQWTNCQGIYLSEDKYKYISDSFINTLEIVVFDLNNDFIFFDIFSVLCKYAKCHPPFSIIWRFFGLSILHSYHSPLSWNKKLTVDVSGVEPESLTSSVKRLSSRSKPSHAHVIIILYLSAFASVIFNFSCFFLLIFAGLPLPSIVGLVLLVQSLTFADLQPASVVLNDKVRQPTR